MKFKFKGYGDVKPFFGDGEFIVGNVYEVQGEIDFYRKFANKIGRLARKYGLDDMHNSNTGMSNGQLVILDYGY